MKRNFVLFCETTTIHGFYYIGRNRNRVEGVFWALVVVSAIICVGLLCQASYSQWEQFPVVSVVETLNYDPFQVLHFK